MVRHQSPEAVFSVLVPVRLFGFPDSRDQVIRIQLTVLESKADTAFTQYI